MVSGYCRVCEKRVPIRPGEVRKQPQRQYESRQRNWYPCEHLGLDGKVCSGSGVAV